MKEQIENIIAQELERANTIHKPVFASAHEGYAVIKEEIEEANIDLEKFKVELSALWECVKIDDTEIIPLIDKMESNLIHGITELIQVAAMCEKFKLSAEGWDK